MALVICIDNEGAEHNLQQGKIYLVINDFYEGEGEDRERFYDLEDLNGKQYLGWFADRFEDYHEDISYRSSYDDFFLLCDGMQDKAKALIDVTKSILHDNTMSNTEILSELNLFYFAYFKSISEEDQII